MENIVSAENTSQQSFDVDMSILSAEQVQASADNSQNPNVHTNTDELSQIEIDERFKELPKEQAIIRTLQSQKDKYFSDYNKLAKDFEEKDKIAGLFDQMIDDEGLLYAFIREIKPDLVKPLDLGTQLKEQLQKEFGEDFKPTLTRDEAERDDPFGKDARYYMKVDALKAKLLQEGGQENVTIKEYLAKKRQLQEAEDAKYEMEREQVKQQYKMSDLEVKAVSDWAMKLKFKDLVEVHRFLRKFPGNPNINQAPGSAPGIKSAREEFLKQIF
ncbi:hypothetical protein [Immundisolibacter sp.]